MYDCPTTSVPIVSPSRLGHFGHDDVVDVHPPLLPQGVLVHLEHAVPLQVSLIRCYLLCESHPWLSHLSARVCDRCGFQLVDVEKNNANISQ